MKVAVLEKNKNIQEYIKAGFQTFSDDVQLISFEKSDSFLDALQSHKEEYDMVLLNTDGKEEGSEIALAQKIRNASQKIAILFITKNDNYYSDAFKVFALGYLLFPFDVRDLQNCINFYTKNNQSERRASWMLKTSSGWRRIYCRYITYIESDNREIIIHLENGQELRSYGKLNEAMEQLPNSIFLRCHQSYIVNLYFIEELK